MPWTPWIAGGTALLGASAAAVGAAARLWATVRERGFDQWLPTALSAPRPEPLSVLEDELDVYIAVCDHYEPEWGRPAKSESQARVDHWVNRYPERMGPFHDVTGRPPQHTCFFPADEYAPRYLDRLAQFVEAGWGDVDVHLHHDNDTPEHLTETLASFRDTLHLRHGLLRRDPATGDVVYGFIHGNWALCNSRRDKRWCGVDHELPVLLQTGCYADFTFPSAPSDTQIQTINQIYYAADTPCGTRAHATGLRATVGRPAPEQSLLMIQGPLLLDWSRRKFGLLPRVENGDLLASHPPSAARLKLWIEAGVTVEHAPRHRFIKLHTHGLKPVNTEMLLGQAYQQFHQELAELHQQNPRFRYHYVTAWEMALKVRELEQGEIGPLAARLVAPRIAQDPSVEGHLCPL